MPLFCPHYTTVSATQKRKHTGIIVHGILGSGGNWSQFTKRLVDRMEEWDWVLMDMRNHGMSGPTSGPHTLKSCAEDITQIELDISRPIRGVIGHSFGGKVALQYGAMVKEDRPLSLWCLDSVPDSGSTITNGVSKQVQDVLAAIEKTPDGLESRLAVRTSLREYGLPEAIVRWLATSLTENEGVWTWQYHMAGIRDMLSDYYSSNLYPLLDGLPSSVEAHFVAAERSPVWRERQIEKLNRFCQKPNIHFHQLPDAGHWLHVDNSMGLIEMIAPAILSETP
jgi:esterase